jgi:hypothetical protein
MIIYQHKWARDRNEEGGLMVMKWGGWFLKGKASEWWF